MPADSSGVAGHRAISPEELLEARAPAKVNLTLRVLGRRPDGFHELESLVVFADVGDQLSLAPADDFSLAVEGTTAGAAGPRADNLVLKAARALASRVPGLRGGRFVLDKRLPVAAGLGGGSSDAAAALRLLARLNALMPNDPRVEASAAATGSDVPVCLDPQPRVMRGVGERLSPPLALPALAAVLANPGIAVATADVFRSLAQAPPWERSNRPTARIEDVAALTSLDAIFDALAADVNDLEPAAVRAEPAISRTLEALRALPGCRLARMSGSGATCFGLFASREEAETAAVSLQAQEPGWWVRATRLGSARVFSD